MGLLNNLKDWLNQEQKDLEEGGMDKDEGVTRLFFATDVHGSTVCWRKFINAAEYYSADVLVLGGDTTGKAIMPIIRENGTYRFNRGGQEQVIERDELEDAKESMENAGYYSYVLTQAEYQELEQASDSQERQDEIFEEKMVERAEKWRALAEERLPRDFPVYVSPGNDDPFHVDQVWEESDLIDLVEGEVVEIGDGYEMASTGWTNPTPWDTDREESESELADRLEAVIDKIDDMDRAIFNFHAPPYDSQLDDAPELDENLKPKFGAQSTEPVGSTAVREAIETYQPPLSLHGHIHESRGQTRIVDTIAVNPGSVYSEGSLQGAIIDLRPEVDVVGLVRG
ncbi:metallophosphoesterase family protein [Halodesulfurarchaeum sp.]|uniref:metallophosphoesterase family protein n=1 Tax=Halodesulfurarchaeum sp. TaxID=1980530 RepID=UPI002FC31565